MKAKIKAKKIQQPAVVRPEPAKSIVAEPVTLPASPEFEEKLQVGIPEAIKRGPGRPRLTKEFPAPGEPSLLQLTDTAVKAAVKIPFILWAETNQMPELNLLDSEVTELSTAVKGLLDYYCPELPTPILLWCNATLTLTAIVSPRLQKIQKQKSRQVKKEQGTEAKPNPPDQGGPGLSQFHYPQIG